jgi:catechol 2,3-dioxygenase-like lactoylglutathione lyase family enzyme
MKRLHVHVAVDDLAQSTRFYSTLFAAEPTVIKEDYAKWMLEDPRVNFAITRGPAVRLGFRILAFKWRTKPSSARSMTAWHAPSGR